MVRLEHVSVDDAERDGEPDIGDDERQGQQRAGSVRTNTVLVTVNASVTPTASHATAGWRS